MTLTAEQHAIRATGLGGSDAAGALGISPWVTPYQLYAEKAEGIARSPIDPAAAEWGHLLEDAVAEKWSRITGQPIARVATTLRSPAFPFMVASLDRAIAPCEPIPGRIPGVLECKTSGFLNPDEWGEDGSDEVPQHYLVQLVHYLIVSEAQIGHIAALFNGRTFRRYVVQRDPILEEMVIEGERTFWQRVVDRNPPPVTTLADVKLRFPRSRDAEIEATPDVVDALAALLRLRRQAKELDTTMQWHELIVKAHMGDASALTVRGVTSATWRSSRPSRVFDEESFSAVHPDLYAQFMRERAGSRRFLPKENFHA